MLPAVANARQLAKDKSGQKKSPRVLLGGELSGLLVSKVDEGRTGYLITSPAGDAVVSLASSLSSVFLPSLRSWSSFK